MVASAIGRVVVVLAPCPGSPFDMAYLASSSSGPTTTAHGPSSVAPPPRTLPCTPPYFRLLGFYAQGVVLSEHDSTHVALYILSDVLLLYPTVLSPALSLH